MDLRGALKFGSVEVISVVSNLMIFMDTIGSCVAVHGRAFSRESNGGPHRRKALTLLKGALSEERGPLWSPASKCLRPQQDFPGSAAHEVCPTAVVSRSVLDAFEFLRFNWGRTW